jgi:hypothetical protein
MRKTIPIARLATPGTAGCAGVHPGTANAIHLPSFGSAAFMEI